MQESLSNKTARTAFWSGIQKISTMSVTFVVSMVLARFLTPDDYGTIALLGVFFAISDELVGAGFGSALIRKKECTQADYSTAFLYNVGVAMLMYVILFIASPYVAYFYNRPILREVMRVSSLSLIISSVNLTQSVQLTRKLDFKKFAIIAFISSVFSSIIGVFTAYKGWGVWALVVSNLVKTFLNTSLLIAMVRWKPSFEFSKDSFVYLWGFGNKMLLSGLLSQIYSNIYSIVIGKVYDARILGVYNRGQSLALLIPDVINNLFNRNTLPILSQIQDDKERFIDVYRKLVKLVSFFNIPACFIFAALAKPFVLFLLTDKWSEAVIYVQLFCLSAITSSAGVINLNIFQVRGRSDIVLKIETIKKTLGLAIVFILMWVSPLVLAIGSVTFNFFCYCINLYYANRLENIAFSTQIFDLIPIFIASVIAASFSYFITFTTLSYVLQLIIGSILGCIIYFIITRFVMDLEIYNQLNAFIKERRNK